MEVGVRVMTEDLLSADRRYCCHAYLTFVALPQPPLTTLTTSPSSQRQDSAAVKAALVNSPAARRYSFSLPSAKSGSKADGSSNSNQRRILLPAIEPITQVEK